MKNLGRILALRFRRSLGVMLALSLLGTGLAVVWQKLDWLEMSAQEASAYDSALNFYTDKIWFPPGQARRSEQVIVVAIDDKTIREVYRNETLRNGYGSYPYSRKMWALVVPHLLEQGARAVVFDATMDDPHPDRGGDELFFQALQQRRGPFYLGFNLVPGGQPLPKVKAPANRLPLAAPPPPSEPGPDSEAVGGGRASPEEQFVEVPFPDTSPTAESALRTAEALAFPVTASGGLSVSELPKVEDLDPRGVRTGQRLPRFPLSPLSGLTEPVAGWGAVLPEQDSDGKIRRTRFAYSDGVNNYVTLSLAVAADLYRAESVDIAPGQLKLGKKVIPINPDGTAEIDYGGTLDHRFRSVSLINVQDDALYRQKLQPRDPEMAGLFKEKVVVICGTALGTADIKATPFSHNQPGCVKTAAELENLLSGRFIVEAPYWLSVLLALGVAFLSVMIITVVKSPWTDLGWPVLLYFGFFLVPGLVLVASKVHLLSVMPNLAGTFSSVAAVAYNHFFARKDREQLKRMFASYMEKDLVEVMAESPTLPKLDGENQEITAFFSDIKGFSSFSEKFKEDPRALMKILNTYLSRVTPVLQQQHGCIDKYIGDAVVCLFGAPVKREEHALDACRAALAVQKEISLLRQEFRQRGWPDVYTRIGLNTDMMLVGNIGSQQLLDYTAIGDGMNLASRLEGTNKHYGTLILMGEKTFARVSSLVEAREVDRVRVAGKGEATTIYELLALRGELAGKKREVVELYARALAFYRQGSFSSALPLLAEAARLDPEDGPTRTLLGRCEEFSRAPPVGFDGITNLEK